MTLLSPPRRASVRHGVCSGGVDGDTQPVVIGIRRIVVCPGHGRADTRLVSRGRQILREAARHTKTATADPARSDW